MGLYKKRVSNIWAIILLAVLSVLLAAALVVAGIKVHRAHIAAVEARIAEENAPVLINEVVPEVQPRLGEEEAQEVMAENLRFFLPLEYVADSYNGVGSQYRFLVMNYDTQCEVSLYLADANGYEGGARGYLALYADVNVMLTRKILGVNWETAQGEDGGYYYVTVYDGVIYALKNLVAMDGAGVCVKATETIEKTLFFVESQKVEVQTKGLATDFAKGFGYVEEAEDDEKEQAEDEEE